MKPIKSFRRILAAIGLVLATSLFALPPSEALIVRPGTHSFQQQWPEKPVLDCRPTENDCGMTYTGASTRTMFDSTGTMVFAPHNLALQSDNLGTNWFNTWSGGTTLTLDTIAAPDGTITADKIIQDDSINDRILQSVTLSPSTTYTASAYFKNIDASRTEFALFDVNNSTTIGFQFNWSSGIPTSHSLFNGASNGQIESIGTGWYRISFVFTSAATITTHNLWYGPEVIDTATQGVYAWGAQLNRGSSVLTYNKTTTTAYYGPRIAAHTFDTATSTWVNRGYRGDEEAGTNTLLRSEEFDNASWTKTRASITADTVAAPDGNTTMDKLVEDSTASNSHYTRQTVTKTAAVETWTYTIFAKKADYDDLTLWLSDSLTNRVQATYDLSAGTAGTATTGGTGFSAPVSSIEDVGGGIYRLRLTGTTNSDTGVSGWVLLNNGTGTTYSGDGSSGTYIWGADLGKKAFPLSYIPTITAQVVRAAEIASIAIPAGYSQTEGTLYVKWLTNVQPVTGFFPGIAGIDDNTNQNSIGFNLGQNNDTVSARVRSSGVNSFVDFNIGDGVGQTNEAIISWAANDVAVSFDGGAVITDNTVTVPGALTDIKIGRWSLSSASYFNGYITRLIVWNRRLPDGRLQDKTAWLNWFRGFMVAANDDFSMIEVAA